MSLVKKIKKRYRKTKRFIKKYIRFLVRHTKAGDYSVLFYTILGFIALVLGIVLLVMLLSNFFSLFSKPKKEEDKPLTTTEVVSEEVESLESQAMKIYEANEEFLILVNYENYLDYNYTFTHHTLNCGLDIDERIHAPLCEMLNDLNEQDLHYSIVSAFRSREEQQKIIQDNVQRNITQNGMSEEEAYAETYKTVQPVGASEHETGLCLDITSEGVFVLTESIEQYPTNIWLMEHCHEYGFILRYPKDKENITRISYEPWHFRYVGIEAATFMKENNLCLEEFYDLLDLDEETPEETLQ